MAMRYPVLKIASKDSNYTSIVVRARFLNTLGLLDLFSPKDRPSRKIRPGPHK